MREFSVPPSVTVGDAANLTDPVWDNAETAAEVVQFARRTADGWVDVTCGQFRDQVLAVARGLVAAGIEPAMRVGLMSSTRYEWTLLDYAIWTVGAITVPIYETSSAAQVAWILSDSAAAACVVETADHEHLVAGLREQLPGLGEVWSIDGGAVDALIGHGAAVDPAEVEARRRSVQADDVATIIYTSGTTGRPKGCVLTHRNMCSDIANVIPVLRNLFHQGSTTLLFLPLAHAFARLIQIGVVQVRAKLGHSADLKNLVADLGAFRPTFILSVPRVFEKVYNSAHQRAQAEGKGRIFAKAEQVAIAYSQALDTRCRPGLPLRARHRLFDLLVYRKLRAALGGRCTTAISGGAPLDTRLGHFFRGIGVTILEGYGLTEPSPAATANVPGAIRLGTVGRPLPGVSIRIADDHEILIKGELVFDEYWNNPEATAEALTDDGWLRTGDLGALDDEGFLTITGRKKEIIVTAGGKHVAPDPLEERVRAHPLISQAVVVGDRRPFVAALVTIDENVWPRWLAEHRRPARTSVADLRTDEALCADVRAAVDDANRAVSQAEAIKAFRILPRDFTEAAGELTPSLKVKRPVVHQTYGAEIADIYGS